MGLVLNSLSGSKAENSTIGITSPIAVQKLLKSADKLMPKRLINVRTQKITNI